MSDGIKVLLGALVGVLLTLLLVGVFSGGGVMGDMGPASLGSEAQRSGPETERPEGD